MLDWHLCQLCYRLDVIIIVIINNSVYFYVLKDTEREIKRLAKFLEIPVDRYTLESILEKTSLESMRKHPYLYYPVPAEYMDPNHQANLFRKGKLNTVCLSSGFQRGLSFYLESRRHCSCLYVRTCNKPFQQFRFSVTMAANQNKEFLQYFHAWRRTTQQTFLKQVMSK